MDELHEPQLKLPVEIIEKTLQSLETRAGELEKKIIEQKNKINITTKEQAIMYVSIIYGTSQAQNITLYGYNKNNPVVIFSKEVFETTMLALMEYIMNIHEVSSKPSKTNKTKK